MADLVLVANSVAPVYPNRAFIRSYIANVSITAGQSLYVNSVGKVDLSSSAASGTKQFAGIALNPAGPGGAVDVLFEGEIAGFTLSTVAYDGLVYISDTAGNLADAAGTATVVVGRVVPRSDSTLTKLLYVRRNMFAQW